MPNQTLFFLLFLLSFTITTEAQIVETKLKSSDYTCVGNGNEEEYLSFDIELPKNFTFLIRTDLCQLLEVEKVAENMMYNRSGYLLIDDKLCPLELNEQYLAMIPQKIYYNPAHSSLAIIEFYLFSHISTSIYRYLVLSFDEKGTVAYKEFDFNKAQKIKEIYREYFSPSGKVPLLVHFLKEN